MVSEIMPQLQQNEKSAVSHLELLHSCADFLAAFYHPDPARLDSVSLDL